MRKLIWSRHPLSQVDFGFSGAILALSSVQAINSIGSGVSQNQEAKYNASIASNQASAEAVAGSITQGQLTRKGSELAASATAQAGAAGLGLSGSVAAVMQNTQTQINTDRAIAAYNTTMGINADNAKATQLRQQGKNALFAGASSAFSDLLTGAATSSLYKGGFGNYNSLNLSSGVSIGDNLPNFGALTLPS